MHTLTSLDSIANATHIESFSRNITYLRDMRLELTLYEQPEANSHCPNCSGHSYYILLPNSHQLSRNTLPSHEKLGHGLHF